MTDLTTSRPAARPLAEDAEGSAYPEPHVELAPAGERLAVWIIAAVGPWVAIAGAVRLVWWAL